MDKTVAAKRRLIEPEHELFSIERQCELVGLNRSTYYYKPAQEDPLNLELMRRIDELYLEAPEYGYRTMTELLQREGYGVNGKRILRLMRLMGIQAVYPKPKTSNRHPDHQVWPYLLRNRVIRQPNEVWCVDITYIPMPTGFMYLVAIMDWFSRFVLAWELSNSMEVGFCIDALERAFAFGRPAIFNSDQGSQFTSHAFTQCLLARQIRISMDGRGRYLDNIFIERLWRTVKYDEIYMHNHATVPELRAGLTRYFQRYCYRRPHQSLAMCTPAEVYYGCQGIIRPIY